MMFRIIFCHGFIDPRTLSSAMTALRAFIVMLCPFPQERLPCCCIFCGFSFGRIKETPGHANKNSSFMSQAFIRWPCAFLDMGRLNETALKVQSIYLLPFSTYFRVIHFQSQPKGIIFYLANYFSFVDFLGDDLELLKIWWN